MRVDSPPRIGFTVFPRDIDAVAASSPDFIEVIPAAWFTAKRGDLARLHRLADRYPIVAYGDTLGLGQDAALSFDALYRLRDFLHEFRPALCGEMLAATGITRSEESVLRLAARILALQDVLGQRIAITNGAYCPTPGDLSEGKFLASLVERADCDLVLDLCNLYVNSRIHGYRYMDLIAALPSDRVRLIRLAECDGFMDILPQRFDEILGGLLGAAYEELGARPTVTGTFGGGFHEQAARLVANVHHRVTGRKAQPGRDANLTLTSLQRERPVANAADQ